MGSGIAQAAAVSGCVVVLQDVSQEQIARARKGIERSLSRLVDKGAVDRNVMDNALAAITTTTAVDDLAGADMVIEAAVENMDLKLELFAKLDRLMKAGAVLA